MTVLLRAGAQRLAFMASSYTAAPKQRLLVLSATAARFQSSFAVPSPPTSNHPHKPVSNASASVIYTETDEAPALATFSLYPLISKVRARSLMGHFCFTKFAHVSPLNVSLRALITVLSIFYDRYRTLRHFSGRTCLGGVSGMSQRTPARSGQLEISR
jgi:hypothetical protein